MDPSYFFGNLNLLHACFCWIAFATVASVSDARIPNISCSSIIFLSAGRSATDTISHTLIRSSSLKYCDHVKEFYSLKNPTQENLAKCVGENPGGVFIHVKPQHIITFEGNAEDHTENSSRRRDRKERLTTPEEFFAAVKQVVIDG